MLNALSVDVEEYFHPTEVQPFTDSNSWYTMPSRVEAQTMEVLDLLGRGNVRATFFVVGWVAERCPQVVRSIVAAGHEVGCHSHMHALVFDLTPAEFRRDTERSVAAIADACGVQPRIYRAPTYSITSKSLWALEILVELGFTRDSSIFPVVHDRYGIPGSCRHAHVLQTPSGPIYEVPVATARLGNGTVVPVGGGAYLRLLPYRYTAAGIRHINNEEHRPACIYFHPWEIDPDQPQIARGFIARARTYGGLRSMRRKLDKLVSDFSFAAMSDVYPVPEEVRRANPACV